MLTMPERRLKAAAEDEALARARLAETRQEKRLAVLHALDQGLSVDQIGHALGVSVRRVKQLIQ